MIGFGRAVGETMIVLMATGNTPVLDWSIFNGMRTLSANIAVEIPEAPYGGTLYRTLFLAGRAAVHDDLPRQHRRGGDPPAPARALPGHLMMATLRREARSASAAATRGSGSPGAPSASAILMIVGPDRRDPGQRPRLLLAAAARAGDAARTAACFLGEVVAAGADPRPGHARAQLKKQRIQLKVGQPRPLGLRLQVDRRGRDRGPRAAAARRLLRRAARVRAAAGHARSRLKRGRPGRGRGPAAAWQALPALLDARRSATARRSRRSRRTRSAPSTTASSRRASTAASSSSRRARARAATSPRERAEIERRIAEQQAQFEAKQRGAGRSSWSRRGHDLRDLRDRGRRGEGAAHPRRLPRLSRRTSSPGSAGSASTPAGSGSS